MYGDIPISILEMQRNHTGPSLQHKTNLGQSGLVKCGEVDERPIQVPVWEQEEARHPANRCGHHNHAGATHSSIVVTETRDRNLT